MKKFWQVVVLIILFFIVLAFYWTRYQIITANYAYAPAFYKIDRLSGEVTLTVGKEFVKVERITPGRLVESAAPSVPKNVPAGKPEVPTTTCATCTGSS